MQPFTPPPLKIVVRTLDGVEDRPFNHTLTPADIRKDAFYQKLARRNAALEWRLRHIRSIVVLAALVVFAFNVMYLAPWTQAHKQAWLDSAFAWMQADQFKSPASVPLSAAVAATPASASSQPVAGTVAPTVPVPLATASAPDVAAQPANHVAVQPVSTPAPAAPATVQPSQPVQQSDAANQLAAAIRALIDQQNGKPSASGTATPISTATNKPITVVPGITASKPAVVATAQPAPVQREPLPVHESAPIKTATPLSIMDFFGSNTAVLLSSDGGQTMRTYRVGDSLPSGEVIKAIDSIGGSVTTNQRIIKKQETSK